MSDLEDGNRKIVAGVELARQLYPNRPIFVLEMLRMFGDICHSTIVLRHYRKTCPDAIIVWCISERYISEFETLKSLLPTDGPHVIVGLPHGPQYPYDGPLRVAWTKFAATLPGVAKVITPAVHPYGWKSGNLADAIFQNAGITKLAVPCRPVLPLDITDYIWADKFMGQHNLLGPYVTMEYISYSLKVHDLSWYAKLIPLIKHPVVIFGGKNEPIPQCANIIDARGCTYRQAKVLIIRSKCFVGCASGNGLLTVSEGCETGMVEIVEPHISFKALGFINTHRPYNVTGFDRTPQEIASIVNSMT